MASIITNGTLFYNEKKQNTVTKIADAQIYTDAKAKLALENLPKTLKRLSLWYIVDNIPDTPLAIDSVQQNITTVISQNNNVIKNIIPPEPIKDDSDEEEVTTVTLSSIGTMATEFQQMKNSMQTILDLTQSGSDNVFTECLNQMYFAMNHIVNVLLLYRTTVKARILKLEMAELDMAHYIEFNNLNACEGFKAYKKLHEILNERRECKIIAIAIDDFVRNNHITTLSQDLQNNPLTYSCGKTYHVRELTDYLGKKLIKKC